MNTNVLICGVVKNCGDTLDFNLKVAKETGELFCKYKILVYENNSTDSTKHVLEKYKSDSNFVILSEDIPYDIIKQNSKIWAYTQITGSDHPCRIEQICNARNKVVVELNKEEYDSYEYVIWIDMDSAGWDLNGIVDSFSKKEKWDVVYGNTPPYHYDLYALRTQSRLYGPELIGEHFWNNIGYESFSGNELIPVYSAFCGIGIYKKELFKTYKFECLITDAVKDFYRNKPITNELLKIADYKFPAGFLDEKSDLFWKSNSGYDTPFVCEHIGLNLALVNAGYRLFVNPKMVYNSYVPYSNSMTTIDLTTIPVVFVCPDSDEKYSQRKLHMLTLLSNLGFRKISMYKSTTDNYPFCLKNAFVSILKANLNDSPILVLEDDIDVTPDFCTTITYPSDTDAFYLGFSKHGGSKTDNVHDGDSLVKNISLTHVRILNMLSGHAILYITKRYKQAIIDIFESVTIPYHTDVLTTRIQENFNINSYYFPFFYQSSKLGNTQYVETATNFKFEKKRVVVTAYYPLQKAKHSQEKYFEWISFFFQSVTCEVVCFCDPTLESRLKNMAETNVTFVPREFSSFEMMSEPYMKLWSDFYRVDPEQHHHSPDLYAVWAAKQEFVREAMKIADSDIYVWCDIGCFRTVRNGSFKSVDKFVSENKITCLSILDTIGGGVLAGDKLAWKQFSKKYIEELKKNPHGKDQVIYKRILNSTNANIIPATDEFGDEWFHLTSLFSQ
jgi:hypothetical protein